VSPAVPAGSRYNRLAMTTRFESCTLPVQSGLPCSESGCSSLPAVASEPLHPVRRARAPAGYKHRMQQIRRLLRIEIPHRPQRRPTRSQQQSMSIPVCSSRSSLSVVVFRRHVFTRCGRSDGRVIWPNLDRAPRTHLTTGARLALLSLFVTTAFPTFAFSSPRQVSPTRTETNEVSIVQLPLGTRLRTARHLPAMATPHSHSETPQPPPAALKKMAEDAATAHTLPVNYFLRLIRQESGFELRQPGRRARHCPVHADYGVQQRVEGPVRSSRGIAEIRRVFERIEGSFRQSGPRAAAYNAGPERIRKWLAGGKCVTARNGQLRSGHHWTRHHRLGEVEQSDGRPER
jgi:hypothetical protein